MGSWELTSSKASRKKNRGSMRSLDSERIPLVMDCRESHQSERECISTKKRLSFKH